MQPGDAGAEPEGARAAPSHLLGYLGQLLAGLLPGNVGHSSALLCTPVVQNMPGAALLQGARVKRRREPARVGKALALLPAVQQAILVLPPSPVQRQRMLQ